MENKTLLQQVEDYIKANNTLKLPFYRIHDAVIATVSACGLDGQKPNYAWIELIKVVSFTINALAEMKIEYSVPEFEKETEDEEVTLNYFKAYDELIEVYEFLYNTRILDKLEILFEKEVELAKDSWIKRGMFEDSIIEIATRFTSVIEDVSKTIQDEKKFGKLMKNISKNFPQLGELIKPKE